MTTLSWTNNNTSGTSQWTCIGCDPTGENVVAGMIVSASTPYVAISYSQNSGSTWSLSTFTAGGTTSTTGPAGDGYAIDSISFGSTTTATAMISNFSTNGNPAAYWVTSDSGASWPSTYALSAAIYYLSVNTGGTVLTAAGQPIQIYNNATSSWSAVNSTVQTWTGICSSSSGSVIAACYYYGGALAGGIYVSTNSGSSWAMNAPSLDWVSIACSSSGSSIVACTSGGSIYLSTNSGSSWSQLTNAPSETWVSLDCDSTCTNIIAVTSTQIYVSNDSGSTWTEQSAGISSSNFVSCCCNSDGTLFYAASAGENLYLGTIPPPPTPTPTPSPTPSPTPTPTPSPTPTPTSTPSPTSTPVPFSTPTPSPTPTVTPSTTPVVTPVPSAVTSNAFADLPSSLYDPLLPVSNTCYAAGTPIPTDQGIINIEEIDESRHTINSKRIVAITKTTNIDNYLICIGKHSFAYNRPCRDTIVTPHHKVFFQGKMTKAKDLLSCCTKVQKVEYKGETVYNILMKQHTHINVNNILCETLHPDNIIAKLYNSKLVKHCKDKIVKMMNESIAANDYQSYCKIQRAFKVCSRNTL